MTVEKCLIVLALNTGQCLLVFRSSIPADIMVVHEIRGSSDIDGGSMRPADHDIIRAINHLTIALHEDAALSL